MRGDDMHENEIGKRLSDIHLAQLLTYLRLGGFRLGYIFNFNVIELRAGIKRVVNGL